MITRFLNYKIGFFAALVLLAYLGIRHFMPEQKCRVWFNVQLPGLLLNESAVVPADKVSTKENYIELRKVLAEAENNDPSNYIILSVEKVK